MINAKPQILAHRGFSSKYPENTLLAFKKALAAGADGWECDVQKTKDGKFAVIHDETVERVSGRKGFIKNMRMDEIKKIRLPEKQHIPELEEMLKVLPENKFLNLELKEETLSPADCPALFRILKKYRSPENCTLSSFNLDLLDYFRERKFPIALLVGNNAHETGYIRFFRAAFIKNPDYFNLPVQSLKGWYRLISLPLIRVLERRKNKISFWVVNNEDDLRLSLPSADVLITDNPGWLVKKMNRYPAL